MDTNITKVLVVDYYEINRLQMMSRLQEMGYSVEAYQALSSDKLTGKHFDLAIIGIQVGSDNEEVIVSNITAIRTHEDVQVNSVPILGLFMSDHNDFVKMAYRAGIDSHRMKMLSKEMFCLEVAAMLKFANRMKNLK